MILNQENRTNCWIWATMAILQHEWVIFDIAKFSELKAPYMPLIQKIFVDSGLVSKFIPLPTPKLVDLWLNRWEYILTGTSRGDFTLEDNEGCRVEFDEKVQHYFAIIKDCWDRWQCQNSWWADWNWDWCFYMKKADFKYLFTPRRICPTSQNT